MKKSFYVVCALTFSVLSNSSFALNEPEFFSCRSSIEDKKIVFLGAVSTKPANPRFMFEDVVKNEYLKSNDYARTVCGAIYNDAAGSAKENLMSFQKKESSYYRQREWKVVIIPGILYE